MTTADHESSGHRRRVELRLFANQEEDIGMQSVEFTYSPDKIDDRRLFLRLRRAYRTRMLKWWMRYHLSFKTLKVIVPVQVGSFALQRFLGFRVVLSIPIIWNDPILHSSPLSAPRLNGGPMCKKNVLNTYPLTIESPPITVSHARRRTRRRAAIPTVLLCGTDTMREAPSHHPGRRVRLGGTVSRARRAPRDDGLRHRPRVP